MASSPTEPPKQVYWRGRPVETLTREELLQAIYGLMERCEREEAWSRLYADVVQTFRKADPRR